LGQGSKFMVEIAAPSAKDAKLAAELSGEKRINKVQKYDLAQDLIGDIKNQSTLNLPRVLICEDNPELAHYIDFILKDICATRIVTTGDEALSCVKTWQPDLVLSDVMMPGKDGFALCQEIKKSTETNHIPVVLLTALTHREALIQGWQVGADEYLFKPFHPRELLTRIQTLLTAVQARKAANEAQRKAREDLEHKVNERTLQLARANEELKQANRIKSEFMTMVTHELRTPLGAIQESVSLVMEGVDGPVTKAQEVTLTLTKNNIDRLARLINNVLDFEKLQAGKVALDIKPVDLREVCESVFRFMLPRAEKLHLTLSVDLPDKPFFVPCDSDRINQVIINLLDNAFKFTEAGGQVKLSLRHVDQFASLSVTDNGIGMRKDDLTRIFGLFAQVPNKGLWKTGGFGVGLAICRRILESHHGRIEVESEQGKGSRFTAWLPLKV
jgi:signal transduction histidine kinase